MLTVFLSVMWSLRFVHSNCGERGDDGERGAVLAGERGLGMGRKNDLNGRGRELAEGCEVWEKRTGLRV